MKAKVEAWHCPHAVTWSVAQKGIFLLIKRIFTDKIKDDSKIEINNCARKHPQPHTGFQILQKPRKSEICS